jgi:hypothetical protein
MRNLQKTYFDIFYIIDLLKIYKNFKIELISFIEGTFKEFY